MKKILVADDDIKTMSYLIDDLRNTYKFDITWAKKAADVLEALSGTSFDAIILDIMMPIPQNWSSDEQRRSESGMSTGLVLLQKIRTQFPIIPIVIYTAKRISVGDIYTSYLMKPVLNSEIVEHLNKLMSDEK